MPHRVLVVGGGMVGLAFAIAVRSALPDTELSVLEARPFPDGNPDPLDTRASALNLASRDILSDLGAWEPMVAEAGRIRRIHVSNQRHFGSSVIEAADVGEDQLGYVVENHIIGRTLKARAEALGIELMAPALVESVNPPGEPPGLILAGGASLAADLVIIADGSASSLREALGVGADHRSLDQWALVANASFEGVQQGTAFERFTPEGPLALLPLPDVQRGRQRFNLVWSMSEHRARYLTDVDDTTFLRALQDSFGWRLGRLLEVGRRTSWPLQRIRAREQYRPGYLIAGNAAHGIHPVAGQGLNLSLRDAARLGSTFQSLCVGGRKPGDKAVLAEYERRVLDDQNRIVAATDGLATLFVPRGAWLDLPRNLALAGLDLMPPLRRAIARQGVAADALPAGESVRKLPHPPPTAEAE